MRDLLLDLRYGARALLARPALAAAAVVTLALGIGITTSIFSIINGIVLHPLPLPNADRLVTLCERYPGASPGACRLAPPNMEDIAASSRTIEAIGIAREWAAHLQTPNGPEVVASGIASPGFFRALGARVQAGRLLEPGDMIGAPGTVAVITHEMWQARFGGALDIVGRVVTLDDTPVTIVGVLAPGFEAPHLEWLQLWRPLHIDPKAERHREWHGFMSYGLLREGVSLDDARAELATIAARLKRDHFATTDPWGINVRSMHDLVVGGVRPTLMLFLGAVVLVLLIGCANVANLLLARATGRSREMALRSALGAGRARIVRALLAESVVLAIVGGAFGVLLAVWATEAFKALAPSGIPRIEEVAIDARVLAFALLLSLGTAAVFGLAPALRAARVDLAQALREGGRTGTHRGGRLGAALVVAELALAVMLVAGAGLLVRTFAALNAWSPGFEREHLLTFNLFAAPSSYPEHRDVAALWDRLESELGAIPGVTHVGTASAGPLFGGREHSEMHLEGMAPDERASIRWYDVSPTYFATLGVPVVLGRPLDARDRLGSQSVGLVNETLANRFWPNQNPLGKRLEWRIGETLLTYDVVGVVRDVPPLRAGDAPDPELYWSNRQQPRPFTYVIVRTAVPPASVVPAIRERLKTIDRSLDPGDVATIPERMTFELRKPRFNMMLLVAFGLTALALAAVGTYGVLSYTVAQRTREIGVRLALGAQRGQLLARVLTQGLVLAAVGVVLGTAMALALGRSVASLVAGVSAHDPLTFVASAVLVVGAAVAACLVPALRASRVDPVVALAAE